MSADFQEEDTKRVRAPRMPREIDTVAASDRALLEHVLAGNRAIQTGLSDLHLTVAGYRGEAMRGIALIEQRVNGLETKSREHSDDDEDHQKQTNDRLSQVERHLHYAYAALAVSGVLLGGVWALFGHLIKKAVTG